MTSESEYRNAVRYLTNLLNGGLMGVKGIIAVFAYGVPGTRLRHGLWVPTMS